MGSEMFVFDEANYYPDEFSGSNFFTDPLSTLSDSSIDSFFQEISDDQNTNHKNNNNMNNNNNNNNKTEMCTQISRDEAQSLDQITHALFSDSPPSNQLETLSIQGQFGHFPHLTNVTNSSLGNVYGNNYPDAFPEVVKSEEFKLGFDFDYNNNNNNSTQNNNHNNNNSYFLNCGETMLKFMQRSYSSNSFDGKPSFLPQPRGFDSLLEVADFGHVTECSQIRRVCSTGDLPKVGVKTQTCTQQTISSTSPISGESSNFNEETNNNAKVGKYNAEERKERIDRYRAKRTQRNFNKTIKYACRKTLADNRPRIRGRFARNDETEEIPKPTSSYFSRFHDHDRLWVDNLQDEEDEQILVGRGREGRRFMNNFGASTQFQYCAYN
ncbi:hypothetical protein vseg_006281 [Gypsophila vaccaria]